MCEYNKKRCWLVQHKKKEWYYDCCVTIASSISLPLSPGIRNTWLRRVRVAGVNVVPMRVTRANDIVPKELNLSYFFYTLT